MHGLHMVSPHRRLPGEGGGGRGRKDPGQVEGGGKWTGPRGIVIGHGFDQDVLFGNMNFDKRKGGVGAREWDIYELRNSRERK